MTIGSGWEQKSITQRCPFIFMTRTENSRNNQTVGRKATLRLRTSFQKPQAVILSSLPWRIRQQPARIGRWRMVSDKIDFPARNCIGGALKSPESERLKSRFGSRTRTDRAVLFSRWAILDRFHLLRSFISLFWGDQYFHSRLHGSAGVDGKRQRCCVHVARQIRNDHEVVAPKGIIVRFQSSTRCFDYLLGSFATLRPALFEHPR